MHESDLSLFYIIEPPWHMSANVSGVLNVQRTPRVLFASTRPPPQDEKSLRQTLTEQAALKTQLARKLATLQNLILVSTSAFGAGGGSSSSSSAHSSSSSNGLLLGRTKSCSALPSLLASLDSHSSGVGLSASKDCMSLLTTLGASTALTADQHAYYRTQQLKCRVESMRAANAELASELASERQARSAATEACDAAVARAEAAEAEVCGHMQSIISSILSVADIFIINAILSMPILYLRNKDTVLLHSEM